MNLFVKTSVNFSDCRTYRYSLTRTWDEGKPIVVFLMLNPSTADEEKDDPTIRRCINFARDWGMGALTVVNLFGFRSPYPSELLKVADPVGPGNDVAIAAACAGRVVVAAWGACERYAQERIVAVTELIRLDAKELCCLGYTDAGQPRHPLMMPKASVRIKFPR